MRDVARLAGVAISTVSALINDGPRVSPARAQRIRDAMQALDYHPDQVARSLKMGRTQTIGVIVPDITNAFYPQVIRGIEDSAQEAGYGVLLCNSNESPQQEQAHLSMLFSRRVDGVLIACAHGVGAREAPLQRRFPLVFVDRIPQGVSSGAICSDNVDAARAATRHLIDLGHRRIALLAGNLDLSPHAARLEGFRRAMQQAHLPVREELLCAGGMQIEDGKTAGDRLLRLAEPPTAVIASNSKLLLGLLRAIEERGVLCPRDISIVHFDESEWSEHFRPRLTAVVQPTYEMGRRAFELLRERIEQKTAPPDTSGITMLQAELHQRESTAPPRA